MVAPATTNFSLVPDDSAKMVLDSLRKRLPEFVGSARFQEIVAREGKIEDRIGLVCAALAKVICEKIRVGADTSGYFGLIEDWAKSRHWHLDNYIVTEIFENVSPESVEAAFKAKLGPASRRLYDEWLEPPR